MVIPVVVLLAVPVEMTVDHDNNLRSYQDNPAQVSILHDRLITAGAHSPPQVRETLRPLPHVHTVGGVTSTFIIPVKVQFCPD